jgi:3',5'-cyclic-AMP phosphodiesterase
MVRLVRLAWLTDVHLSFLDAAARAGFAAEVAATETSGVVITGDIGEAGDFAGLVAEIARAAARPAWFVLGNHDFYGGSIAEVRERAAAITGATWLPRAGVVRLDEGTALVGHDGWGDARLGDFAGSRVVLNDFVRIRDLTGLRERALRRRLEALGDEAATYLRGVVGEALAWARHVVVATHVPPWREACWHEGAISGDDWLPFFSCKAVGDVLAEAMRGRDARMTVLCGHTHGGGEAEILPNLRCITGAAEYGAPVVRVVDV